jgi:hypothetical protein
MNAKHHLLCKCLACMSKNVLPAPFICLFHMEKHNGTCPKCNEVDRAIWDKSATKATHPDTCECITCQRYNMAMMRIEALRDVRALWRAFFQIACRSEVRK